MPEQRPIIQNEIAENIQHGGNLLIAAVFLKMGALYQAPRKTGNGGFDLSQNRRMAALILLKA